MDIVGHPVRFAWNNLFAISGATITGNLQATALPWINTVNPLFTKVGAGSGLTTMQTISYTLPPSVVGGSGDGGQIFFIKNHNLATGATISIVGSTNGDHSPLSVQIGLTVADDLIVGEFGGLRDFEHWQVQVTGQTVDAFQMGYVFFGPYNQFDIPDFATNVQKIDPSIVVTAYGGGRSTFKKTHFRQIDFALSPLQQADRREFETVFTNVGNADPLFLMLDPWNVRDNENANLGLDGIHRFTMLGYLSAGVPNQHLAQDWFDGPTLTFTEARE